MTPHSLFISDLHLCAEKAHSMAAFIHFIETTAPQAQALYILGDLFDYWAGDDDLNDPFNQRVIQALRSLPETQVYLMRGNRDLLMGDKLAQACDAQRLNDPTLIDLYGTPTLLTHGDLLCTDDIEYQNFRKHVQAPEFRDEFLSRPLAARKTYITQLRLRSESEKKIKSKRIMDVNAEAVALLLRQYHYPRLIHGHTHRPCRHEHLVDGKLCERWVLSDWHPLGSALYCDDSGIKTRA
ncbi:MAG: UDP-2,3-diacylglucosamine diphosphatase [Gallionella sp.]